jgi:ligand-binding sensor domain-containing protein/signal transduction histidine kinase/CheY-like chemotaxis protein
MSMRFVAHPESWLWAIFLQFIILQEPNAQPAAAKFHSVQVPEGFPNNSILAITQDQTGFMWFGTYEGLCRYDGHRIITFSHQAEDDRSLPSSQISALLTDRQGRVWVGTDDGLGLLHPSDGTFSRFLYNQDVRDTKIRIWTMIEDRDGRLWVGTSNGIYRWQPKTEAFEKLTNVLSENDIESHNVTAIRQDKSGAVWVVEGIYLGQYSPDGKFLRRYNYGALLGKEGFADKIRSLAIDAQQRIWIGAQKGIRAFFDIKNGKFVRQNMLGQLVEDQLRIVQIIEDPQRGIWAAGGNGVNYFNTKTLQRTSYRNNPEEPNSLIDNGVMSIFRAANGVLWVGTYNSGVQYMLPKEERFKMLTVEDGLSYNIVSSVSEKSSGELLVATSGGGIDWLNPNKDKFTSVPHLQRQWVHSAYVDPKGDIWVGADGLKHFSNQSKIWKHYRHDDSDSRSISSGVVLTTMMDLHGRVWVGTSSGLDRYDPNTGEFVHNNLNTSGKPIYALLEDSRGNLWIGSSGGMVYVLKKNEVEFRNVSMRSGPDSGKIASGSVLTIAEDVHGTIWIGGHEIGLKKYNVRRNTFEDFDCPGLHSKYKHILSMQSDAQGRLWLGMLSELVMVDPSSKKAIHFGKQDGISISEFSLNAVLKDSKGHLYFGTNKGLLHFDPQQVQINKDAARVIFTGLQVNGRTISANDSSHILNRDIASTTRLTLNQHHHYFTVFFSLLSFIQSEKNSYEYKLEGVDSAWRATGESFVTFNDLAPGTYKLIVRGYNNDQTLSQNEAVLTIILAPAWWQSWWAYLVYAISAMVLVAGVVRYFWMRASFDKEVELNQAKINFFTNISHEIRTHLTLIIAPLSHLLASSDPESEDQQSLKLAHNNSKRLLSLATELLDFRRIESNQLKLQVMKHDLVAGINKVLTLFEHAASEKNIRVSVTFNSETIPVFCDLQQLDKAIFNILSNAFKFVGENGHVSIDITENQTDVKVRISNDGKPIPQQDIEKLFKNYFESYRSDGQNRGYGIGLALAKAIVALHHGSLTVHSDEQATSFEIVLLRGIAHFSSSELATDYVSPNEFSGVHTMTGDPEYKTNLNEKQADKVTDTILIAEDNIELLDFIAAGLNRYRIIKCTAGDQAWEQTLEVIPDLVLTDVMMSGMSGNQLCNHIKSDSRTLHIPVIVLTAQILPEQIIETLELQADHYMVKPFDLHELELRISNLLSLSKAVRKRAVSEPAFTDLENKLSSQMDRDFVAKLTDFILRQMTHPQFGADMLAREMGMGRSVFYKKVKSVTGMSVNDFAKIIRVEKAAELLRENVFHVNEVAEMVGFSDRRYFSKEFAKITGKSPSQYVKDLRG